MPRVIHFEIHADDPQRAMSFYGRLFGWEFQGYGGPAEYWLVVTGKDPEPGIDGGLMRRQGGSGDRINSYVCVVGVDDIDAAIARARALGAPEALPKQEIPGVGWSAYFKDTEGNVFGLYQALPRPGGQAA